MTPAGVHVVTVYVRDLPVELSDETVKSAFSSYGEVYSVRHGYFKDFPDLRNGNRLILMSVCNPIPSSLNVLGFVCRTWHPGQPVHCTICKESGHLLGRVPSRACAGAARSPVMWPVSVWSSAPVPVPDDPVPDDPVLDPDLVPVPVTGSEDDILYFVFWLPYCHTLWRHQYLICIIQKSWISLERDKIWQKGKRHSSSLLKAFQFRLFFNTSIFHFHRKLVMVVCSIILGLLLDFILKA